MLCSTLSDNAYNDWLHVSPINSNSSDEIDKFSLDYLYSPDGDSYRNTFLSNRRLIPVFSTFNSTPGSSGKTLMPPFSPSITSPTNISSGSSKCLPSLDSHCILSPDHSGTMDCLQNTPFDDCYKLSTPLVSSDPYVSPIIRASSPGPEGSDLPSCTPERLSISTFCTSEGSFLGRLRASVISTSSPDRIQNRSSKPFCLLSPCKSPINRCLATPPVTPKPRTLCYTSSTSNIIELLSPLTPLPEDTNRSQSIISHSSVVTKRRLKLEDHSPRHRKSRRTLRSNYVEPEKLPAPSCSPSPKLIPRSPAPSLVCKPIFTNRAFPEFVPISPDFPMFYRRFPASSFLRELSMDSLDTLHPGGTYNPPRWPLDLYSPRFVKGKGTAKLGLCPICVEPAVRGGHNVKLWFAMKFSAFKCYHMQYTHGISASTGLPFSPPVAYRRTKRLEVGKKEKPVIQEGKCHKCKKWVAVEGIKDMESKVKEIFWWKHAASCHHGSTISGESREDVYERDSIYEKLLELANCIQV